MCHFDLAAPVSGGDGTTFEQVEIDGEGVRLPCYLAKPAAGLAPTVLIIHDIHGANAFYQDLARRLANEEFIVLLPDYFCRQGRLPEPTREAAMERGGKLDQLTCLRDIAHSLNWLGSQPGTNGKTGIVGFCMGGTYALLAAGRDPLPAASVAYYGFPAGRQGQPHKPIEEIEQLRSPVLAFWGDQDHGVGMDNVAAYEDAARAASKDVESVVYPGLPHGFLTFDRDSPNFERAQDSWVRTLRFFRERLTA